MKKILYIILILVVLFAFGFRIVKDLKRYKLLKSEVNDLLNRQNLLLEEEKRLETLKEEGSRVDVLEKEARETLGLQKTGEKVVLVVSSQPFLSVSSRTSEKGSLVNKFQTILARLSRLWYNFCRWIKINIKK
ncbi:MAG: septum formation initiator family protein [Minisyncoccia bacterium]